MIVVVASYPLNAVPFSEPMTWRFIEDISIACKWKILKCRHQPYHWKLSVHFSILPVFNNANNFWISTVSEVTIAKFCPLNSSVASVSNVTVLKFARHIWFDTNVMVWLTGLMMTFLWLFKKFNWNRKNQTIPPFITLTNVYNHRVEYRNLLVCNSCSNTWQLHRRFETSWWDAINSIYRMV